MAKPKRKSNAANNPTAPQVKEKKVPVVVKLELSALKPLTKNQAVVITKFEAGRDLAMIGSAGTGKTYLAMALGLKAVDDGEFQAVVIIRSAVPVREIGFAPGKTDEKVAEYELPYYENCEELYGTSKAYGMLKNKDVIRFVPTSFLRGRSMRNVLIIADEVQNMSFAELNTVLSRVGKGSRVIMIGDGIQSDLTKRDERNGFYEVMERLPFMPTLDTIEFTDDDVVRSGFVKDWLLSAGKLKAAKAKSLLDKTLADTKKAPAKKPATKRAKETA